MSLSFDDKILGEKVDNYCSSSDENEDSAESNDEMSGDDVCTAPAHPINDSLDSQVAHTGPKGVIADYKQYRRLKEKQDKLKSEMALQMAKGCALTCRPYSADQLANEQEQKLKEMFEDLMDDDGDDDAFLIQYRRKRLAEMQSTLDSLPTYSRVYELNTGNFVSEIDKEPSQVTVIIHIYEEGNAACKSANEALQYLCKAYPHAKFCRIRASVAFLSRNFIANGVPAILVYKNKELIGNLISIAKELDDCFTPEDLETYLFEHGFLPPKEENVPASSGQPSNRCVPLDSDSD